MIGGTAIFMFGLSFNAPTKPSLPAGNTAPLTLVKSNSPVSTQPITVQPTASTSSPSPQLKSPSPVSLPAAPATDGFSDSAHGNRFFRDSHGALMSEKETEAKMEHFRGKVAATHNDFERAYLEGVLKALEKEWSRIKSQGEVHREPVATASSPASADQLTEAQKRRIYFELVAAQDSGIGDAQAFFLISKRYQLPTPELLKIVREGCAKGWPMP
jgi:hypothetical protein